MRVIVIGAGEVGSNIAASLADTHEVVVIERDPDRVQSLTYQYDVLAMQGDGTSLSTLEEANVGDADILIASTDSDEANIVACATAKTISEAFTIARVKKTDLLTTWENSKGAFGVDFMVCTDLLTAESIVRIAGLPGAQDVDAFAGGRVRMAQFEVPEDSPVADQSVQEADRYQSLTFAAIIRNGDVTIPRGDTIIEPGDNLVVIGSPESVRKFAVDIAPSETVDTAEDVFIVGGGEIGYQTARLFEERNLHPRLIEQDPERARTLAERLPNTVVLQSDATDVEFLTREHIDEADLVVVALDNDEKSLLVSLLTKRLGAERTVTVVDNGSYVELVESVGIDVAVNPREVTAEEITRFTREEQTENVAIVESDRAEVLEIEVDGDSLLTGRSIAEVAKELPRGVVIGAITRNGTLVTPRGNTVVETGDHVVVFVDATVLDEVTPRL